MARLAGWHVSYPLNFAILVSKIVGSLHLLCKPPRVSLADSRENVTTILVLIRLAREGRAIYA